MDGFSDDVTCGIGRGYYKPFLKIGSGKRSTIAVIKAPVVPPRNLICNGACRLRSISRNTCASVNEVPLVPCTWPLIVDRSLDIFYPLSANTAKITEYLINDIEDPNRRYCDPRVIKNVG